MTRSREALALPSRLVPLHKHTDDRLRSPAGGWTSSELARVSPMPKGRAQLRDFYEVRATVLHRFEVRADQSANLVALVRCSDPKILALPVRFLLRRPLFLIASSYSPGRLDGLPGISAQESNQCT